MDNNIVFQLVILVFEIMFFGMVVYIPYMILNKIMRSFARTAKKTSSTIFHK